MEESDSKIRDFSKYLLDIGFLNGSNFIEFCKKFKEINNNSLVSLGSEDSDNNIDSIYFKDNVTKTIVDFYNSMNEEKKKLCAINIYSKYIKKKEEENNKDISHSKNIINNKNIEYVIESIEPIIILATKQNKIKSNQKEKVKIIKEEEEENKGVCSFNNLMDKLKNKKGKNNTLNKRYNNFTSKKNKNSEEENKQNKIQLNENCTFHPNINISNNKNNNNKSKIDKNKQSEFFERLSKKSGKKEEEIKHLEKERDKENIFQPNFDKNKKIQKKLSRKNFEERLKKFEDVQKDKETQRKKEEEKEFKEKFPFRPKRHNSFNKNLKKDKNSFCSSNENLYQRLYDDNKKMKNKYEESLKKVLNDIKDRANHPIVKHNNINYIKKMKRDYRENYRNNMKNMSFDKHNKIKLPVPYYQTEERKEDGKIYEFKRIEELYEEYKRIKNQIILKENINNSNDINKKYSTIDEIINNNNNEDNNKKDDNIIIDNNKENNIIKNNDSCDINNNENKNKEERNNNEIQIEDHNNIENKEIKNFN